MGDMVAVLTATLDEQILAIYTRGGVRELRDALNSPYLYLPHDAVVPQFLLAGDMPKRVETLGARPVARVRLVDARNRPVGPESREQPAQWLMQQLKR